jgi:hypothetical protein
LVFMGLGAQVEDMRRPITLLPTLRSTSTALLLSLGLGVPACGDDGGSFESGDEPGTTGEPDPDTGDTDEPGETGQTEESGTTGDEEPTLEEQLEGHWISEACEPMPQADGSVLYFGRELGGAGGGGAAVRRRRAGCHRERRERWDWRELVGRIAGDRTAGADLADHGPSRIASATVCRSQRWPWSW